MSVRSAAPRDEVDRITAQWNQVAPHVDADALHVFSRISRISRRLEDLRREAFAAHGLEPWEFDVLSALRRAGDPFELTPGALMHDTLVTSGTITARVEKLQAKGLVTKSRAPGDGRSVVVRLAPRGLAQVDNAIQSLVTAERALLDRAPRAQVESMTDTLRTLLRAIEDPESAHSQGPLGSLR